MYIAISVLIMIVCFFLVLFVLVQNSKGGGLAAGFASQNQYMGVRKTADFLEKATWILAGSLIVLCILSTLTIDRGTVAKKSAIEENVRNAKDVTVPQGLPQAPAK